MCNIKRHGIAFSSNNTFSPVFVSRRIEIDYKGMLHWLVQWVVISMVHPGVGVQIDNIHIIYFSPLLHCVVGFRGLGS